MKSPIHSGPLLPPRTVGIAVGLVLCVLAAVYWVTRPAAPHILYAPPSALGQAQVWLLTTPTAGLVEPAAPLRVQVTLPNTALPAGGADPDATILLELWDAAGQPAVFGTGPASPQAMFLANQPPRWTADLSAPTVPGTYHVHLTLGGDPAASTPVPTQTLDLLATVLQVVAPATSLVSGFVYGRDGNLWLTSTDGTRTHKLTFLPRTERADEPAWSLDGQVIAYSHRLSVPASEVPASDIWSVRPDGTDNHLLVAHAPGEDLHFPAWTPDGQHLLITVMRILDPTTGQPPPPDQPLAGRSRWTIETVDRAGGGRQLLVADALEANLSRDGSQLTYIATPPFTAPPDTVLTHTLMLAQADGSHARALVPDSAYQDLYAPRLAPDGRQVVFAAINPEGWAATPGGDLLAALAPPVAANGVPWDIYLVDTAGGAPRRLTRMQADMPTAAWGQTAGQLMTITEVGIFQTPPDGSKARFLAPGALHGYLSWYDH